MLVLRGGTSTFREFSKRQNLRIGSWTLPVFSAFPMSLPSCPSGADNDLHWLRKDRTVDNDVRFELV